MTKELTPEELAEQVALDWFRTFSNAPERPYTPMVAALASAIQAAIDTALEASRAREARLRDGSRPLPADRDTLGRLVREAWVRWAQTQPNPKPSWLAPYDELSEPDKEADRQIGETIARWTLIHDSARVAGEASTPAPHPCNHFPGQTSCDWCRAGASEGEA